MSALIVEMQSSVSFSFSFLNALRNFGVQCRAVHFLLLVHPKNISGFHHRITPFQLSVLMDIV
jgi:hypothetical protein